MELKINKYISNHLLKRRIKVRKFSDEKFSDCLRGGLITGPARLSDIIPLNFFLGRGT